MDEKTQALQTMNENVIIRNSEQYQREYDRLSLLAAIKITQADLDTSKKILETLQKLAIDNKKSVLQKVIDSLPDEYAYVQAALRGERGIDYKKLGEYDQLIHSKLDEACKDDLANVIAFAGKQVELHSGLLLYMQRTISHIREIKDIKSVYEEELQTLRDEIDELEHELYQIKYRSWLNRIINFITRITK